jgi:hypothetical protein
MGRMDKKKRGKYKGEGAGEGDWTKKNQGKNLQQPRRVDRVVAEAGVCTLIAH